MTKKCGIICKCLQGLVRKNFQDSIFNFKKEYSREYRIKKEKEYCVNKKAIGDLWIVGVGARFCK